MVDGLSSLPQDLGSIPSTDTHIDTQTQRHTHETTSPGARHRSICFLIPGLRRQKKQADLCESKVSLVYIVSFRPARDTQ